MNTVFKKWSNKCQVEGNNIFPSPSSYALANAAWHTVSLHCSKSAMLTHVELVIHQDPEFLFNKASAYDAFAQSVLMHGVVPSPVQNRMFAFVEVHEAHVGSFL